MLHKAWNSKGEMPYCFPRSSIKFQGHTVQNITDFYPNWEFPDYRPVAAFKSLRFALFLYIVCYLCEGRLWFQCIGYDYTACLDYMDPDAHYPPKILLNLITHPLTAPFGDVVVILKV